MDIMNRIHALNGASKLRVDAAFEAAQDAYNKARDAARYARDDVKASEADDREMGLLQTSAKTDRAQAKLDVAVAEMKSAWQALEAERARYGKVFLRDLEATAQEVADLTLSLSNAVQAVQGHAWAIANFASRNHLPIHRSLDHAASLDPVVRRLRFQG